MNDETFVGMFLTMYSVLIIVYILILYFLVLKKIKKKKLFRGFHNAVKSIKAKNISIKDSLEQLTLNYNKLSQEYNNIKLSLLDVAEQIIYFYDTYTDELFQSKLQVKKDYEIRDFLFEIVEFIKQTEPFNNLPAKEANLLNTIKEAIVKDNKELGNANIVLLASEIFNKEKTLKKKETDNQVATTISIIGVVLTIFFGILSFIKI